MAHRIVWTDSDKQMLADTAVALRTDDPTMSKLDALREAQSQLARSGLLANRTRKIATLAAFPWFEQMLADSCARIANERRIAEQQRIAEEEAARMQSDNEISQAIACLDKVPVADLVRALIGKFSDPNTSIADVFSPILKMAVSSIQEDIVQSLVPVIERVTAQAMSAKTLSKSSVEPSKQRPRVIVIGLKGGQPQAIKRKFGEDLDITFFESSIPSAQLRANLKHTDHVFFMSGWNSHSVQDILQSSKVSFDYVNGTNSSLSCLMAEFVHRTERHNNG